jgi:hypothetical protein
MLESSNMAKKKSPDTIAAETATETKTAAPRRRRAEKLDTAADVAVNPSTGSNGTDSLPSLVSAPDAPMNQRPTYDEIAQAAYLRYLNRGGGDGQDFEDWLAAEQDLKTR